MKYLIVLFVLFGIASCHKLSKRQSSSEKSCSVARDLGSSNCDGAAPGRKFFFDKAHGVCQPFQYRGCGGNGNRFDSAQECKDFCVNGPGAQALQEEQKESPLIEACGALYSTDHITAQSCETAANCPSDVNYECNKGYCCAKKEYLCKLDYDAGKFAVSGPGKSDRYFYSTNYKVCMRFSFYGSLGNENNFPSFNTCQKTCAN
ncbi:unnamed protein product, partial [Mesorhabditis belari]|uniref:BPTI/Kunitz inhibitor domain-containing protein n=1 Tax=Mesorhabditis belari TaxID=2138241 RepID=A0AAF3EVQ9_9BILA